MDYLNDTPISRKNKHLNAYERGQIALLYSEGLSAYAIAKRLNRASNTIRNELKRGTVLKLKPIKRLISTILTLVKEFMKITVKIVGLSLSFWNVRVS